MNKGILDTVVKLAKEVLEKEISAEDNNKSLVEMGLNSISFINLTIKIETEFGFEFNDDDLDFNRYKTLDTLRTYVEERIQP